MLQIQFYSQVNILAIYLALGVGADSVFVMVDCWNQGVAIVLLTCVANFVMVDYCNQRLLM